MRGQRSQQEKVSTKLIHLSQGKSMLDFILGFESVAGRGLWITRASVFLRGAGSNYDYNGK